MGKWMRWMFLDEFDVREMDIRVDLGRDDFSGSLFEEKR